MGLLKRDADLFELLHNEEPATREHSGRRVRAASSSGRSEPQRLRAPGPSPSGAREVPAGDGGRDGESASAPAPAVRPSGRARARIRKRTATGGPQREKSEAGAAATGGGQAAVEPGPAKAVTAQPAAGSGPRVRRRVRTRRSETVPELTPEPMVPPGEAIAALTLASREAETGAEAATEPEPPAEASEASGSGAVAEAPVGASSPVSPGGSSGACAEGAENRSEDSEDEDPLGVGEALRSIEALFGGSRVVLVEDDGLLPGGLESPAPAEPVPALAGVRSASDAVFEEAGAGGRSWRLQQGIAAGALVAVLLVVAYLLGRGSASPPPVQGGGGDTFVASVPVGTAPEPSEPRADGEQPRGGEPAARQVASRSRAAVAVPLGIAARVPEPASRPAASRSAGAGAEGGASSAPAQPASLDGAGEPRWQIMVMSHVPKEGAERIRSYLESKGYRAYVQRSGRVYNVRVGDYHDKGSEVARRDLDALRALPYQGRLEFKSAWFVRWKKLR